MKRIILLTIAILSMCFHTFSQNLHYEIVGLYNRSVKKATLNKATSLADIISDYPANWIDEYKWVQISTTVYGKQQQAKSTNELLTPEQKNLLMNADLATEVIVEVSYMCKNPATNASMFHQMRVEYTVVPEVQANFKGGQASLDKYFDKGLIGQIETKLPKQFTSVSIQFTVDERGQIINTTVVKSSGIEKFDKLLANIIKKMLQWQPAENANGERMKQSFIFRVIGFGEKGC